MEGQVEILFDYKYFLEQFPCGLGEWGVAKLAELFTEIVQLTGKDASVVGEGLEGVFAHVLPKAGTASST